MKKILILLICIGFFSCENPPIAKEYSCVEFSANCEIEKDYILILPVDFDPKTIDAYGQPIKGRSDSQWYIIPRKTQIMVPAAFHVCTGYTGGEYSSPIYTSSPTVSEINNCRDSWRNKIRADSVNLSSIIPGLTKAIIVVSGPNEILVKEITIQLAVEKRK